MVVYFDFYENTFLIVYLDSNCFFENFFYKNFLFLDLSYSCCKSKFIFNYSTNYQLNDLIELYFYFNVIVYK